ncbi:MAG: hypothetical protein JWP87_1724 [Labilithrix sp.]|nr:hypothetical protein [Labilithrix sp.]
MPQSLHRTWAALAVATVAVFVLAMLTGRAFVRDVYPECARSIELGNLGFHKGAVPEAPVALDGDSPFHLRFDQKTDPRVVYGMVPQYSNVRIEWTDVDGASTPCTCGSIPVYLLGEAPSDLQLSRVEGTDQYLLKGRWVTSGYGPSDDVRVAFVMTAKRAHHLQSDRIFTRQHLPALIALLAMGALVVALLRSRRAMSYALRRYTWTEARLTPEGLLEGESGATLGTLEQSHTSRVSPGPVLVAPGALASSGLYRDVPIVPRRSIIEGTHARWSGATMQRLRDARALAVLSTLCTALAFGARLIA